MSMVICNLRWFPNHIALSKTSLIYVFDTKHVSCLVCRVGSAGPNFQARQARELVEEGLGALDGLGHVVLLHVPPLQSNHVAVSGD